MALKNTDASVLTAKRTETGIGSPLWKRLPYVIVEDDSVILDDFSKLKGYIIVPPSIEGVEKELLALEVSKMNSMLKAISVSNAFFQFTSIIHTDYKNLFKRHMNIAKNNILSEAVANERIRMLFDKAIDTSNFVTIVVPLNAGVTVDGKKKKIFDINDIRKRDREMSECERMLMDTLMPLGYKISQLSGKEYMQLVSSVINPGDPPPAMNFSAGALVPLRKRLFNSDFFIIDNCLSNGRYYFANLVMDTMPDIDINNGDTPMVMANIMSDIDFPIVYNYTILNDDQNRIMSMLENQRKMAIIFSGKKSAEAISNNEKIAAIDAIREDKVKEGWKILRVFISFLVWDKDIKVLNDKLSVVRAAVSKQIDGAGLFTEWLRKESAFVATLPGCASRSYDMLFMPSYEAANMIPMRGQFCGERDEPAMLHKNRQGGIAGINPFSKKQNKWAGIVVGPSGSGKSYFLNAFMLAASALDPFIIIIDMATMPSYEPITNALGGSFISVNLTDAYRVNMFDIRVGFNSPYGSKILSLDAMLTSMLTEHGKDYIEKPTQSLLQRAIKRLYDKFFKEEPRKLKSINVKEEIMEQVIEGAPKYQTFLEYRDYYITKYKETSSREYIIKAEMAQNLATPILSDFVQILSVDEALVTGTRDRELCIKIKEILSLYAQGPQAMLFNGVTNLIIDQDVYCFHLGMIKERREILSLLLLLYRDFAFRKSVFFPSEIPPFISIEDAKWIMEKQKRPKLFLYDEFHNLTGHSSMAIIMDILNKDARQQRTIGMATYLATQEITDISGTGGNFLQASANKYLTRHISPDNPNMQTIEDVRRDLGLNSAQVELLKGLTFYPGKYAEVFALSEDIGSGMGVLRVESVPMERWLFTTHKDERYIRDAIIEALAAKGIHRRKAQYAAVSALSTKYPDGGIGKNIDPQTIIEHILSEGFI